MNYQNIPRSDKVVKTAFVPKLDALLFFDYRAIEMRMLAYYMATMGDRSMVQAIVNGTEDLHTISARGALGIYDRPLTDEERQVGKVLNFSIVYGGGAPTLMRQLGISYPEARAILEAYHASWPGIRALQAAITGRMTERGYITTLKGRHLKPESDHKALNALVQGSSADLLRSAIVKVDEWQQGESDLLGHSCSNVHDELIFDIPAFEVLLFTAVVPRLMVDEVVEAIIPIETDLEISWTNWASKAPYEREVAA